MMMVSDVVFSVRLGSSRSCFGPTSRNKLHLQFIIKMGMRLQSETRYVNDTGVLGKK